MPVEIGGFPVPLSIVTCLGADRAADLFGRDEFLNLNVDLSRGRYPLFEPLKNILDLRKTYRLLKKNLVRAEGKQIDDLELFRLLCAQRRKSSSESCQRLCWLFAEDSNNEGLNNIEETLDKLCSSFTKPSTTGDRLARRGKSTSSDSCSEPETPETPEKPKLRHILSTVRAESSRKVKPISPHQRNLEDKDKTAMKLDTPSKRNSKELKSSPDSKKYNTRSSTTTKTVQQSSDDSSDDELVPPTQIVSPQAESDDEIIPSTQNTNEKNRVRNLTERFSFNGEEALKGKNSASLKDANSKSDSVKGGKIDLHESSNTKRTKKLSRTDSDSNDSVGSHAELKTPHKHDDKDTQQSSSHDDSSDSEPKQIIKPSAVSKLSPTKVALHDALKSNARSDDCDSTGSDNDVEHNAQDVTVAPRSPESYDSRAVVLSDARLDGDSDHADSKKSVNTSGKLGISSAERKKVNTLDDNGSEKRSKKSCTPTVSCILGSQLISPEKANTSGSKVAKESLEVKSTLSLKNNASAVSPGSAPAGDKNAKTSESEVDSDDSDSDVGNSAAASPLKKSNHIALSKSTNEFQFEMPKIAPKTVETPNKSHPFDSTRLPGDFETSFPGNDISIIRRDSLPPAKKGSENSSKKDPVSITSKQRSILEFVEPSAPASEEVTTFEEVAEKYIDLGLIDAVDQVDFNSKDRLFTENLLDDGLEIYIVQCPEQVDGSSLVGQKLNLNLRDTKITLSKDEKTYDVHCDVTAQKLNLVVPRRETKKFSLHAVPVSGKITISESVVVPDVPDFIVEPSPRVPFPTTLKSRNSLASTCSSDTSSQCSFVISINKPKITRQEETPKISSTPVNSIVEKCRDDVEVEKPHEEDQDHSKETKKKKKKKKKDTDGASEEPPALQDSKFNCSIVGSPEPEEIPASEPQPELSKKKKKKNKLKKEPIEDVVPDSRMPATDILVNTDINKISVVESLDLQAPDIVDSEPAVRKKKKKKKKHEKNLPEDVVVNDDPVEELQVVENHKLAVLDGQILDTEQENCPKKKKKKKKHKDENQDVVQTEETIDGPELNVTGTEGILKKKKKKKRKLDDLEQQTEQPAIPRERLLPDSEPMDVEPEQYVSEKKKNKHKKHTVEETDACPRLESQLFDCDSRDLKKKKKRKLDKEEALVDELEEPAKKKKKTKHSNEIDLIDQIMSIKTEHIGSSDAVLVPKKKKAKKEKRHKERSWDFI